MIPPTNYWLLLLRARTRKKSVVHARRMLATRLQKSCENMSDYVRNLKVLSAECNFEDVTAAQYMVRDALVNGVQSSMIRQRLL